jgi:hypothetical protein
MSDDFRRDRSRRGMDRKSRMDKTGPARTTRTQSSRASQRIASIRDKLNEIQATLDRKADNARGRQSDSLSKAAHLLEEVKTTLRDV